MFPEMLAEFIGTFVLILVGEGVVAVVALFGAGAPGEIARGTQGTRCIPGTTRRHCRH